MFWEDANAIDAKCFCNCWEDAKDLSFFEPCSISEEVILNPVPKFIDGFFSYVLQDANDLTTAEPSSISNFNPK